MSEGGELSHAHGSIGLIVNMVILQKAIYIFSAILIKIHTQFLIYHEWIIIHLWKQKKIHDS